MKLFELHQAPPPHWITSLAEGKTHECDWFNVHTKKRVHADPSSEYGQSHMSPIVDNPEEFGYKADEIEDGAYAIAYTNGWVRVYFHEPDRALLFSSIKDNFNNPTCVQIMHEIASALSASEIVIADVWNSKNGVTNTGATFMVYLDPSELSQGNLVDMKSKKPFT